MIHYRQTLKVIHPPTKRNFHVKLKFSQSNRSRCFIKNFYKNTKNFISKKEQEERKSKM